MGNTINSLTLPKISGSVLIIVLLLSLMVSMMVMIALETSVLQMKITRNYQYEVLNFIETEQTLQKLEDKMLNEAGNYRDITSHTTMNPVSKLQFVPDTLAFGERQGTDYYLLDVNQKSLEGVQTHLQSVVAIVH